MRRIANGVRWAIAVAAASGAPGATMAADAASDALEEVVVTAQFREQNLQTTPLSITAMSAEMLESRNQTSIDEIANQAPNVTLRSNSAAYGPSLGASIRGVGQFDFNPALEPGVGLYVDDVYYATLTGSVLDLMDLDRVEILRGPQGTLAGRNSIGGAVKLYSRRPTGSNGGYVAATYGSFSRADLRASADLALTDTLFAQFSGVSKHTGGYVTRLDYGCLNPSSGVPILTTINNGCRLGTMGDVNYDALRAALRWVPSDRLDVSGAIDFTNDDRSPAAGVLVQATNVVNSNIQPVQGAGGTALPLSAFVPPPGSYYNYATFQNPRGVYVRPGTTTSTVALETRPDPRAKFKGWGASGNVDWTIADKLSLKSITAYREYDSYFANDNDLSPLANSLGYGFTAFHSFSQELRLNGAAFTNDALEYTLGAFYMDQTTIYQTTQDLRYAATGLTQFIGNDPVNADTTAVFGHLSWAATDRLTLTAGLRHTDEHKDYTFRRRTYTGALHPTLGILDGLKSDYDGSRVDYRGNVQFQWTDSLMTYLQYATGFKGGGISPRPFSAAQAVPFDPELLKSYEAGLKSDLFDRRLRINASVFLSDYTDLQLSLTNCPQYPPATPCQVIANAGDAEMRGFELESLLRPIPGLSIDASYSYLHFKYTALNPNAGGPTRPAGPQFGMVPPYVPRTKASLGVQYEFAIGDLGLLIPRVDASYQSELYTNAVNLPTARISPYTIANARLTWRNGEGTWESAFEVSNLTDRYYFTTRFDQFTTTGATDGQPGRPREYALTVKRKF